MGCGKSKLAAVATGNTVSRSKPDSGETAGVGHSVAVKDETSDIKLNTGGNESDPIRLDAGSPVKCGETGIVAEVHNDEKSDADKTKECILVTKEAAEAEEKSVSESPERTYACQIMEEAAAEEEKSVSESPENDYTSKNVEEAVGGGVAMNAESPGKKVVDEVAAGDVITESLKLNYSSNDAIEEEPELENLSLTVDSSIASDDASHPLGDGGATPPSLEQSQEPIITDWETKTPGAESNGGDIINSFSSPASDVGTTTPEAETTGGDEILSSSSPATVDGEMLATEEKTTEEAIEAA